jgi:signal transduction histidine kinase
MAREEDLAGLSSGDDHVRLQAARALYDSATPDDRAVLTAALNEEQDRWVRGALTDAIARLKLDAALLSDDASEPGADDEMRASGFDDAIRVVLHELKGLSGDLRESIVLAGVSGDQAVMKELGRFTRLMTGLDNLTNAGGPPDSEEFDVSLLVTECLRSERPNAEIKVALSGPKVLMTMGDPARIELALRNGIRNAIDSVEERLAEGGGRRRRSADILVTWGDSGPDLWIGVLDRGLGVSGHFTDAFEFGRTSKPRSRHSGLGLTIARRAMHSIGGSVSLGPRIGGGAEFVVSWPGRGELQ